MAASILPTQEGFFFGCTDYDDGYIQDLEDTIKQLEPILNDTEGELYYHASW
jgi:hypothetical protein